MATPTAAKRKLVLKMSVSLDGFVAGPNGEADWVFRTSGGDDSTRWVLDTLGEAGVHIMGSGSYYDMAVFWPYSGMPLARPMDDIPKVIFSRQGLDDGTRGDQTTRAFAEAKARNAERHGSTPTAAVLDSWARPTVARGSPAASSPPASSMNTDWPSTRWYWARASRCLPDYAARPICDCSA